MASLLRERWLSILNSVDKKQTSIKPDNIDKLTISEGFSSKKVSNTITTYNGNRRLSSSVNSLDFSSMVINKRRSTTSLESINETDKKELTELPMVIDTGEVSHDDKAYLLAIEEQKKKREEILRQKEWKRDIEV